MQLFVRFRLIDARKQVPKGSKGWSMVAFQQCVTFYSKLSHNILCMYAWLLYAWLLYARLSLCDCMFLLNAFVSMYLFAFLSVLIYFFMYKCVNDVRVDALICKCSHLHSLFHLFEYCTYLNLFSIFILSSRNQCRLVFSLRSLT